MAKSLRVLVVDDSPLFAEAISQALSRDPEIEIADVAADGLQAVELARRLLPDLITMDINMPVMGGLEAIEQIMAEAPTPILVVTGDPRVEGGELNFEALRRGALDVMAKPGAPESARAQENALIEKVKLLAGVAVVRRGVSRERSATPCPAQAAVLAPLPSRRARDAERPRTVAPRASRGRVVGIVASTGGPAALAQILEKLPADFAAPVVIVQHIASGFAPSLTSWLDDVSPLRVVLAEDGAALAPGVVYLAPDGHHVTVTHGKRLALTAEPPLDGHRPSGTLLLSSVARVCGRDAVGVILTGMGRDGVPGLQEIRAAGGVTLAQDEPSCVVFGMPKAAVDEGAAQRVVPLARVAEALCRIVNADGGRGAARRGDEPGNPS